MLGTVLSILCIFPLDSHKKFWEINGVHRWWQLRLNIQKNIATRSKANIGSLSVQLQLLMIYSKPLLSMKGSRFQGGAIITKTPLHASSATQFPCVFWTMPIMECSYLYPPS